MAVGEFKGATIESLRCGDGVLNGSSIDKRVNRAQIFIVQQLLKENALSGLKLLKFSKP